MPCSARTTGRPAGVNGDRLEGADDWLTLTGYVLTTSGKATGLRFPA
jgi:hypothetical protein